MSLSRSLSKGAPITISSWEIQNSLYQSQKKKKGKKEGIKKEIPLDDLDWKKQIFLLLL